MSFSTFNPEAFTKFFPMPDAMGGLTQDAVAASTESTRASVKGMQEASATVMRQAKEQMALSVETSKKLSEVSTLEDALTLQANFVKSAVEANLSNFSELTELYTETMREAFAPLAKQAKKAAKASA